MHAAMVPHCLSWCMRSTMGTPLMAKFNSGLSAKWALQSTCNPVVSHFVFMWYAAECEISMNFMSGCT